MLGVVVLVLFFFRMSDRRLLRSKENLKKQMASKKIKKMEVGLRFPSLAKKKKKAVVSAMGVWYMRMPCNAAVTFFDVWLAGGKK